MALRAAWAVVSLATQLLALDVRKDTIDLSQTEDRRCPSMFAAVFSAQENIVRRKQVRKMWVKAHQGWGHIHYKFALCNRPLVSDDVLRETEQHKDIAFLDCEEGYLNGALTIKAADSMEYYIREHAKAKLFMKIDDDTFISTRRICNIFDWRKSVGKSDDWIYAGVFSEGPNETIRTVHVPIRDPESKWYEPTQKFNGDVYPPSAKGGPGYILSRKLVQEILHKGIASDNILNNEDKAVGVWVDKVVTAGKEIDFLNLPGTDGYEDHSDSIVTSGKYSEYPHFVHHHLNERTIHCMYQVDSANDPDASVDHCFKYEKQTKTTEMNTDKNTAKKTKTKGETKGETKDETKSKVEHKKK